MKNRTSSTDINFFSSRNLPSLWEFSLRLSRDPVVAERLVEQAFAGLIDSAGESTQFSALVRLFALTYSIWDRDFRQSTPTLVKGQRPWRHQCSSVEPDLGKLSNRSRNQRMIEAIEDLPVTLEISLALLFVESLSYAEVAFVLNQAVDEIAAGILQARTFVVASCELA